MDITSPNYFKTLKEKLINAGIPEDIAKRYSSYYERGLMPELAFDNDEMPSDDCFETLFKVYDLFYENRPEPINQFEIKGILSVPYSQVRASQERMKELLPEHSEDVLELYNKEIQVYYLKPDEVTYLYDLISDYISEDKKLWQVFKVSTKVGVFCTESRFEAVEAAVGKDYASQVIYESVAKGYLLHPYYTDPIAAFEYLRSMFDEQTTAKIVLENPEYLYLYKDEYYIEFPHQKQKRKEEIQAIIEKYK